MNLPLLVAGALAVVGAAIHGGVGEAAVVRKLSPAMLPSSPFGGAALTKAMIRVAWHMATIGLATVGAGLLLAGSVLDGEAARATAALAAAAATGFGLLAVGVGGTHAPGALRRRERNTFLHPGPVILVSIPILAWWGIAAI